MKLVHDTVCDLQKYCELEKFKGWDPYDALNSQIVRFFSFDNKYLRAGFTQFFRSSSINFRKLAGIKKEYNPKGIGLFLESYSKLYSIKSTQEILDKINLFLDILENTKSKGYSGNCWGYNFPWQSRVVFKPKWTPTIVNTAFIGHALLTCYDITGNLKAFEMAKLIPDFMLKDLNRDEVENTFCFSYSPLDKEFVHNANMLGSSFLLRIGKITDNSDLIKQAHKSLNYSLNKQNSDGSWYFADRSTHQWIDSFHTGFKLESIRWFIELGEGESYLENYRKGVEFYKNNFFLENGLPKYYHNKVNPIDIHAPSEAIYFFSKFNDNDSNVLTEKVISWTIENMRDKERNYFYFRIYDKRENKIPYMRWSQAWMLRGLSEYLFNKSQVSEINSQEYV